MWTEFIENNVGSVLLVTFVELILSDLSWATCPVLVTSTFCDPYGPTCPCYHGDPGVKKTGLGRHGLGLDPRGPGLGLDLALLGLGPDPC